MINVVEKRDGWADALNLDLKKAFDKVLHRRLMWKLEMVRKLGGLLNWMEDILKNRMMK